MIKVKNSFKSSSRRLNISKDNSARRLYSEPEKPPEPSPYRIAYNKNNQVFKEGLKLLEDTLRKPKLREQYMKTVKEQDEAQKKKYKKEIKRKQ